MNNTKMKYWLSISLEGSLLRFHQYIQVLPNYGSYGITLPNGYPVMTGPMTTETGKIN